MYQEPQIPAQPEERSPMTILVIDDDNNIIELIRLGLKYEGFQVESTDTGSDGLAAAQRVNPALIVLDILLPDLDGLEVCSLLRANPTTRDIPVLMLTAKDDVRDRVTGLQNGADDYLVKPFDFDELVARIRAILRRARRVQGEIGEANQQILAFEDLKLNTATHEVTRAGRQIDLTSTEYNLLLLFMSHPRQVLDRLTILNRVWGYDFMGETNIIEVYVRYLREKIEDTPSTPRLIQTIRGSGYILKG
jgi:two-component system, OmpR family, response regulator MprA